MDTSLEVNLQQYCYALACCAVVADVLQCEIVRFIVGYFWSGNGCWFQHGSIGRCRWTLWNITHINNAL